MYSKSHFSKIGISLSRYDLKINEQNSSVTLHMDALRCCDAEAIARIWGKNPRFRVRAAQS